ncbi:MAG: lycopene cyclase [Saprospiraceae bacterium]|nr:lycopene cyclase [Saprospiraceae bacterium]
MESFDYIIVGAGAAGLQLVLAMQEDSFFATRQILIIEKSQKNVNDKTWCFWEKGPGKWDQVIAKSWSKSVFVSADHHTPLDLGDYKYKMLRSIDFYRMAKDKINDVANIRWITDEVKAINQGSPTEVITANANYQAKHVFDSQIDGDFYASQEKYINVLQHFKGWLVETKDAVFDPECFTMMDFRIKYPESTSFTYVLPVNSRQALVEFTFFSPQTIPDDEYDYYLKKYMVKILGAAEYEILEIEKGLIPMSNYPFHKSNSTCMTKIGTAGSWVKASSGYSFKNAEKYSAKIIDNIKHGRIPNEALFSHRHKKYDSLFLDVLYNNNHLGERLFSDMYTKNDISQILAFLDEDTTLIEELKIITTFPWNPFLKALKNHLLP